jgi:type VI secretion system protein ImpE
VLGDPPEWLANVVLANAKFAAGENEAGCELRRIALRSARVLPGSLNGEAFEFLMDADARIGPIIEVVLEGRYFWVPVHQIARVEIQPPSDLHDLVWARAQFTWANQGVASGLIPVRYSALPNPVDVQNGEQEDSQLLLARKTDWSTRGPGVFIGRGQRHLETNRGLTSLYETREIVFTHPGATESAASVSAAEIIRG